ncbi:DUF4185 domain-containing protein [Occallatibacter riparius]|uniref:DUF4185 domain-containing protein n=1 Tax=Occallatibacter riparius TaxID=1002689 RepID=A0A9J7BRN7_9BACT|nr:DUF4185 domain-containing protein [Occallatibacter riparius]UWZ85515.1 DUF4185 domain-containing protein [Occallatibacter riparius]
MQARVAAIRSVRSLGYAATGRGNDWRLIGQDGGQSIALNDGRSLFLFSDTLLAPLSPTGAESKGFFLSNCAAFSPASSAPLRNAMASLSYIVDDWNKPRELLCGSNAEQALSVRFWPEHGIQVENEVIFFYLGIQQAERGTWGFVETGNGLAKLDLRTGVCSRWSRDGDWRPWPQLPVDCHCGVQLLSKDGYVFVFSTRPAGLEYEAFLARVTPEAIEEPESYSFFTGERGWSAVMTSAAPIARCGSEFSVAYNEYLGCFVMTYIEPHAKQLCLRTAPEPWGPYSDAIRAGIVPHHPEATLVSLGFQHPQFDVDGGRTIYISYSQPHFAQNAMIELCFR